MDWGMLFSGLMIVAMIAFLAPRAKALLEQSAQSKANWKPVVISLALVLGFVLLLVSLAKGL